jgi:hypothetical protein
VIAEPLAVTGAATRILIAIGVGIRFQPPGQGVGRAALIGSWWSRDPAHGRQRDRYLGHSVRGAKVRWFECCGLFMPASADVRLAAPPRSAAPSCG